jgi:hypothetical protein
VIRLASQGLPIATVLYVCIGPSAFLQTPDRSPYLCDSTPVEDRLPEAIAAMAGHLPVFLVEGDFGRWSGSDAEIKSAWASAHRLSEQPSAVDALGLASTQQRPQAPSAFRPHWSVSTLSTVRQSRPTCLAILFALMPRRAAATRKSLRHILFCRVLHKNLINVYS